ncbi:DUF2691 family protein [Ornithinibacillus scapharcae]|uniref:DUF2691 family protein n=1 Tax=Ornithinibacillus scapharcae TaxID=1147159 RepID=UPI000225BA8A|nr:DUF2691 family protein [Ornithinibacillus scapharcae]
MVRGISFEIPNTYGTFLHDILHDLPLKEYIWKIDPVESYVIEQGQLGTPLFQTTKLAGDELYDLVLQGDQYLIFVDLKAFPNEDTMIDITTFEEFLLSECQFVLLVVDSSFVRIYAKELDIINHLYRKTMDSGYKNIAIITEDNDKSTSLTAF